MAPQFDTSDDIFQKTTLGNGLRVVTSHHANAKSVAISIFVGVGSRYESEDQAGISHFIEHMVFKGTKRRPSPREVSATIEETGGVINAGTEQELTNYWCKIPAYHFRESLDLLIDLLRNSVFDLEDIEKERMVIIEELNSIMDYPNYKVDSMIDEMLWPNHPLGRDIGGTKESVSKITRDMMIEYMDLYYTPSNIVVSVAGNLSHQEVVKAAALLCGDWSSSRTMAWSPVNNIQSKPQFLQEYRKTEHANFSIAVPGLSLEHPDRHALDILSVILGESMSSRLFLEVRERQGLAYDIHSSVIYFQDCGAFVISAGVDPKKVYEAVFTIISQLNNLKDGVPEEELEIAKRLSAGRILLKMEDTRAVSGWIGIQETLMGQILNLDQVIKKIQSVTTYELRRVAKEILVSEKLNMALVGPSVAQRRLRKLLEAS